MTAIFLLILAIFQLVTAQQKSTTIATVVIKGISEDTCPSHKEIEDGILAITSNVEAILESYISENYTIIPECGEGLWYRVAYLNMTDRTQQCPSAWRLYNDDGVKACGRPESSGASCPATFYPTGRQYSKVCGRVTGYQVGSTDGFYAFSVRPAPSSVNDIYLDGVSVTHGYPESRTHIWTFVAGLAEGTSIHRSQPDCPCARQGGTQAPTYIGNNYYCESGNSGMTFIRGGFYRSDPLWDGQQCEGQCCSNGKSPPWFSVELPNPTTDDIEVRICSDETTSNEDTPVNLVEIFII